MRPILAKTLPTCLRLAWFICAGLMLGGCETVAYYSQLGAGQWQILRARQPIDRLLADPATPDALAARLRHARALLQFAEETLLLPARGQYQSYADIGREYALWVVFAAPELSLRARRWCYPLIGCANYRGYFAPRPAQALADRLNTDGYDTLVSPVQAYSTLGWFSDPLLNTFLTRHSTELSTLLFHELAHQLLYVPDDTEFNESFASVVADEGLRRWLRQQADDDALLDHRRRNARRRKVTELIEATRAQLRDLYASTADETLKRTRKGAILAGARCAFLALVQTDARYRDYQEWFTSLNNAKLLALQSYQAYVPGLQRLLESEDHDLERFYQRARQLGKLSAAKRKQLLATPK